MLIALLAQAASPVTTIQGTPPPEKFSILAPVPTEPCRPGPAEGEVLVCGKTLPSQRLPYPDEAGPARPRPSNPDLTGHGALAAMTTPCAARADNCAGSAGIPILPMALMLGKAIAKAAQPKPDKSKRVPIPLDPPTARAE